jgi:UDP-glucuronate 4-epimerase
MAAFKFTQAILEGRPIEVYNYGKMRRDFTYIDDIVEGVIRVLDRPPIIAASAHPEAIRPPYRLYNIGNNQPVELLRFIEVLEDCLGMSAKKNLLPLQPGDVLETYADIDDLVRDVGFQPSTPVEVGLPRFVNWYRERYTNPVRLPAANHAL